MEFIIPSQPGLNFHHFFVSGLQERGLIFPTEDEVGRKLRVHMCNPKKTL